MNLRCRDGRAPIHTAVENGHQTVVDLLITARCSVDIESDLGRIPLLIAAVSEDRTGSLDITKQLVAPDTNVDIQNNFGVSVLHLNCRIWDVDVTKQVIATRCNVDLKSEDGSTPLHEAVCGGHGDVTRKLIAARCNVNLQDFLGNTVLYRVAGRGYVTVTERLLVDHCNMDVQDAVLTYH